MRLSFSSLPLALCHAAICFGLLLATAAHADSASFTGSLDPTNPNDVYLLAFDVTSTSTITIQSYGYGGSSSAPNGTNAAGTVIAAGGFDTYFTLFTGAGPTATFLASNDDGGCGPAAPVNGDCEDSRLSLNLAVGAYTLALSLPNNFSSAENQGSGDLGDGFIGLQGDYFDFNSGEVRTSNFAFDLSGDGISSPGGGGTPPSVTPEPESLVLVTTGIGACVGAARRRLAARK